MRFLVLGAGAVGGYFGARLLKGGADVTFLVRPGRAVQLQHNGLIVKAQDGEIRLPVKIIEKVGIDSRYDAVLLCCKAYDLDEAINAIGPAIGEQSVVLPVLNGVKHHITLRDRFGSDCVLGGLMTINAVLLPDGSIQQSQLKINTTAIGELDGQISDRCATIQQALDAGGLPATVSGNITSMLWSKLFAFACSTTIATLTRSRAGSIARSAMGTSFVVAVIEECTQIVTAEGFPPLVDFVSILRGMFSSPFPLRSVHADRHGSKAAQPKPNTRSEI